MEGLRVRQAKIPYRAWINKFFDSTDIEKVQVKFCKFIMDVNKRVVNLAVKGDLGRFPISF